MDETDAHRIVLRRQTHAIGDNLAMLSLDLATFAPEAAQAVNDARSAVFAAWTMLCVPPDDAEDD